MFDAELKLWILFYYGCELSSILAVIKKPWYVVILRAWFDVIRLMAQVLMIVSTTLWNGYVLSR